MTSINCIEMRNFALNYGSETVHINHIVVS